MLFVVGEMIWVNYVGTCPGLAPVERAGSMERELADVNSTNMIVATSSVFCSIAS